MQNGGPITKEFLAKIFGPCTDWGCKSFQGFNIDTRVHMLMPGWWPCIPGWHHDDVPRRASDGQPNYDNPEYKSKHILALVNGDICPTNFAVGECEMTEVPSGEVIYKHWHNEVEQHIANGVLKRVAVPSNKLVYFDCDSFHEGTQAVRRGWRWFGRVSWDAGYEQGRPHFNEIRRQVNVYMTNPTEGW